MSNESHSHFPGVFVPREVLLNERLTSTEKMLFGIIQSLDNERGCYASNGYLGKMLGVGQETIRQGIQNLEEQGLVSRISSESGRTVRTVSTLSFTQPPKKICTAPQENLHPPTEKSVHIVIDNSNRDKERELPYGSMFATAWNNWVEYRRQRKKPLTKMTIDKQVQSLATIGETRAIAVINMSIERGWLGLFPDAVKNTNGLSAHDHNAF